MTLLATRFAALALAFGILVGDTLTGQEPEAPAVVVPVASLETPSLPPAYRVPYSDSPQPVRIRIPALDLVGRVQPVGMSDATTMQVPSDIAVVGWFDRSVHPISPSGHAVLAGHRDGTEDPDGIFRRLGDLRPGDAVTVRDQSGRRVRYEVETVELLGDDQFARQAPWIFRTEGEHALVLITCGGAFDEARGGYQGNVVVVAKRT